EAIGLVLAANMAGFIAGCLFGQPVIRSVGHIRAYAAFTAFAAISVLGLTWFTTLLPWLILRFTAGFATAALSVVTESWLNEMTRNEKRGQMLTLYVLLGGLFYGLGQLAAPEFDPNGGALLVATAALYIASMIPLT